MKFKLRVLRKKNRPPIEYAEVIIITFALRNKHKIEKMQQEGICQSAEIIDIKDDIILTEITVNSSCARCRAKSLCLPSENRKQIIEVKAPGQNFEVGEIVEIVITEKAAFLSAFLAYIMPMIVLFTLMFVFSLFISNSDWVCLCAIAGLVAYFIVLYLFKGKIDNKIIFSIKKI